MTAQPVRNSPPLELLDPDGEGIYVLADDEAPSWPAAHSRAASILGVDSYREVKAETVFMWPSDDGETWRRVDGLRWMLRLNLPRRFRPTVYLYCTPA